VGVLIDATLLIDHERGRLDLTQRIAGHEDEPFFLSVLTVSELLHCVYRAADPVRRANRSAFVEAVIDRFPLLSIDLPTARAHAGIWSELTAADAMIGAHDLWLAAAAVAHDLTLATANTRAFRRVAGLRVADWSTSR
jgi:predicted nucleic acid-binding protein